MDRAFILFNNTLKILILGLAFFIFSLSANEITPIKNIAKEKTDARLEIELISNTQLNQQYSFSFDNSPRLLQLLNQGIKQIQASYQLAHLSHPIYWEGAKLFANQDSPDLIKLKQKVLDNIKSLKLDWVDNNEQMPALSILETYIQKTTFKPMLTNKLDPDKILLGLFPNSMINQDAILFLPIQPKHIYQLGSQISREKIPYKSGNTILSYLRQTKINSKVETLYLLTPNAEAIYLKFNDLDKISSIVMPDSIIFIPFQNLPKAYQGLNQLIVQLLIQRVQ